MFGNITKLKFLLISVAVATILMFLLDINFYMEKLPGSIVIGKRVINYTNKTETNRNIGGLGVSNIIIPQGYTLRYTKQVTLNQTNGKNNGTTLPVIEQVSKEVVNQTTNVSRTLYNEHKVRSPIQAHELKNIPIKMDNKTISSDLENGSHSKESEPENIAQPEEEKPEEPRRELAPLSSMNVQTRGDKMVKVLLLSYQRCGSSLLGYLFGNFRDVFYVYEPLDALYSSLFGTAPGWNVPIDITFTRYGQLRYLPQREQGEVAKYLNQLFNCDIWNVPREFYVHHFWFYFKGWNTGLTNYVKCLKSKGISDSSLGVCHKTMRYACGRRFGDSRSGHCAGHLWPDKSSLNTTNQEKLSWYQRIFHGSESSTKEVYMGCVMRLVRKVDVCIQKYLVPTCTNSKIRAVKTVRATMQEAEILLKQDPEIKVIHLFRDPRGTARSRKKASWSWGLYGRGGLRNEALAYCKTVHRDIQDRIRLEKIYPHRIKTIVLEGYMRNPLNSTDSVYEFLGIETGKNVTSLITSTMKKGFVEKWMTDIIPEDMENIQDACKDVYDLIPEWKRYGRAEYEEMYKVNKAPATKPPTKIQRKKGRRHKNKLFKFR